MKIFKPMLYLKFKMLRKLDDWHVSVKLFRWTTLIKMLCLSGLKLSSFSITSWD